MSTTTTTPPAVGDSGALKQRLLDVARRYQALAAGDPPGSLADPFGLQIEQLIAGVSSGVFRLVVMGEIKKGKSSFINALLNYPGLLPVETDIATSTVYKIVYGPVERYTVFFEPAADNSAGDNSGSINTSGENTSAAANAPLPIAREQLADYGTEQGNPNNRRQVAFIAVELPAPLLKAGLVLVDTPGVGGLFRKHRDVTFKYAPQADVVLFVVDSVESVISRDEISFLQDLRKHTEQIAFVQTKIDLAGQDQVATWRDRNLAVLSAELKIPVEQLPYFPISSKMKVLADEAASLEDLRDSGFPEMLDFLQRGLLPQRERVVVRRWLPILASAVGNRCQGSSERLQIAQQSHSGSGASLEEYDRQLTAVITRFQEWQTDAWPTLQRDFQTATANLQRTIANELDEALFAESSVAPYMAKLRAPDAAPDELLKRAEAVCIEHAAECNEAANRLLSRYRAQYVALFERAIGACSESLSQLTLAEVAVHSSSLAEVDASTFRTIRDVSLNSMGIQNIARKVSHLSGVAVVGMLAAGFLTGGAAWAAGAAISAGYLATEIWSYVKGYQISKSRQSEETLRSIEAVLHKTCQHAQRAARKVFGDLAAQLRMESDNAFFNQQKQFRAEFEASKREIAAARARSAGETKLAVERLSAAHRDNQLLAKAVHDLSLAAGLNREAKG